jgi:hypothetical protein
LNHELPDDCLDHYKPVFLAKGSAWMFEVASNMLAACGLKRP